MKHAQHFHRNTFNQARGRRRAYAEDRNPYFLEFVRAEPLDENHAAVGLWFAELYQRDVMGHMAYHGTEEEIMQKQGWLSEQGYSQDKGGEQSRRKNNSRNFL